MKQHRYVVYILSKQYNNVLYTGVTNDLPRRLMEHRTGHGGQFTNKYKVCKLVYFKEGHDINQAIAHEKVAQAGSRARKIDSINTLNPQWNELFEKFSSEPNDQQVAV